MKRHPFDAVSFFFGVLFVALAAWALLIDELDALDGRWLWPGLLVLAGIALIAPLFTHRTRDDGLVAVMIPVGDHDPLEAAKAELPEDPFGSS
jgi:hypothetical protein